MYERHVPVERFLPLLVSKNLQMRFPETTCARMPISNAKTPASAGTSPATRRASEHPGRQPPIRNYLVEAAD
jgi:hypothetical protein